MLDEVQLQFEKEQTLRTGSNRDNKFYRKQNIQKNYSDGKFKVDDDSKKIYCVQKQEPSSGPSGTDSETSTVWISDI